MTKKQALKEFERFCNEVKTKHRLSNSDSTISGMIDRLKEFKGKIEPFNDLLTKKANELAKKIDGSELVSFEKEAKIIANRFLKDYFQSKIGKIRI